MKKTILLFVLLCWGANAQDIITFSGEFSHMSKGFELRKEFNSFYVAFYGEQVYKDQTAFDYGLNTGLISDLGRFTAFYGVSVGITKEIEYFSTKTSSFTTGLQGEIDYNFNQSFYIGAKCRVDYQIKQEILIRPMFKIGYKF